MSQIRSFWGRFWHSSVAQRNRRVFLSNFQPKKSLKKYIRILSVSELFFYRVFSGSPIKNWSKSALNSLDHVTFRVLYFEHRILHKKHLLRHKLLIFIVIYKSYTSKIWSYDLFGLVDSNCPWFCRLSKNKPIPLEYPSFHLKKYFSAFSSNQTQKNQKINSDMGWVKTRPGLTKSSCTTKNNMECIFLTFLSFFSPQNHPKKSVSGYPSCQKN